LTKNLVGNSGAGSDVKEFVEDSFFCATEYKPDWRESTAFIPENNEIPPNSATNFLEFLGFHMSSNEDSSATGKS
jgi:hypothetical protein